MSNVGSNKKLTNANPLDVAIVDGNGDQVTAFGGGSGGTASTDDAPFTIGGAGSITPVGFLADEVSPDTVDEGDAGLARMTLDRKILMRLVGATDANRADVNASGHVKVELSSETLNVAHDAVDTGNPFKIGGKAISAEPAAVSAADRVNALFDLVGKLIVLPYANPENFVSGVISSAMASTTSTSLIGAPGANLRNYITQITVSNASTTIPTDIIIQDGSGGTTYYVLPCPIGSGTGTGTSGGTFVFPTPLRQPTTNTAVFCANVTTGSSTKVSASGYKGV